MKLNTRFQQRLCEAEGRSIKTIGFLPGRFQPFHKGHYDMFKRLEDMCGQGNVYVLTSDDTSSFKSPLSFVEKRTVITRLFDIPGDRIIKVTSPYRVPSDLVLDQYTTRVLFAVSEKDMKSDPRFDFPETGPALRADGEPRYLQKYPGSLDQCEMMATHGYVVELPVYSFSVCGNEIQSASELRELFVNPDTAECAFQDAFDKADPEMMELLKSRIERKALTIESVLTEGGNVWKNELATQRVDKADILPTVQWLEKITGLSLVGNFVGTTGVRPTSGDIDIAVDGTVPKSAVAEVIEEWARKNDPGVQVRKSGDNVHVRCPIAGDPKRGYVQTDLMFVPDLKFALWSMGARPSKFKMADKFIVISSIARELGLKYTSHIGLISRTTNQLIPGGRDPDTIARVLLGPNAKSSDLDSLETIVDALGGLNAIRRDHPYLEEALQRAGAFGE
jgi:cytidyltransferase-like protein